MSELTNSRVVNHLVGLDADNGPFERLDYEIAVDEVVEAIGTLGYQIVPKEPADRDEQRRKDAEALMLDFFERLPKVIEHYAQKLVKQEFRKSMDAVLKKGHP